MPDNQQSYLELKTQLDQIVEQIRDKDLPLERALDLYEEAVRLGNSCADHIDRTDFSMEEIESFNASKEADEPGDAEASPVSDAEAEPSEETAETDGAVEQAEAPGEAELADGAGEEPAEGQIGMFPADEAG